MTQKIFSPSFKRAFKKRVAGRKDLEEKFWRQIGIFTSNPFDSRLRTHKLSRKLKELWSFSLEYRSSRGLLFFAAEPRNV